MMPSWYPETAADFSGSFFREQAEALAAAGHTVGVLAVRGFAIYQLAALRARPSGVRSAHESGVAVLRRDVLLPVPKAEGLKLKLLERAWLDLYERYEREHGTPDVLHAHTMLPAGLIAARISRRTGVPFVVTEHRPSVAAQVGSGATRRRALAAARDAGALVAVSTGFADALNAAYDTNRWQAVPGLLSPQLEGAAVRPVPTSRFVFGHVSHLDEGKRVDQLIDAFADAFGTDGAPDEASAPILRIVGDSPERAALEARAAGSPAAGLIEFVGAVPRERITDEFAGFSAFVLTSDAETFGTVFWEAMALGIPVIASDTWGGRGAARPDTGILVPVGDRAALTAALIELRERFDAFDAAHIRARSIEHCGRAVFVNNYVEVYRKAGS